VPAAEAKKDEGASDDTRRTPRPPFLTGLRPLDIGEVGVGDDADAYSQSSSSNLCKVACPLHGAARKVCISLGTLNDALNSTSASCAGGDGAQPCGCPGKIVTPA